MAKRTRANGEGTVFKRKKDGRWVCELVVGHEVVRDERGQPVLGPDGLPKVRRKVLRFSAPTKQEVLEWRARKLAERQQGLLVEPSRITVGEFLNRWLETAVAPVRKPSTYVNYRWVAEHLILPDLGSVPLQKLTPGAIQALYAKHVKAGRSARTVALLHAVLRRALGQAVKWGLIARNPTDGVEKSKGERKEFTALTAEQAARFLEAAQQDRLHALFTMALLTGLRLGELLALRWSDVDLEARTVTVRQTLQRTPEGYGFGPPKTEASSWTVPLDERVVAALRRWRREQAEELLRIGMRDPELVFTTEVGTPLNPSNVRNRHFLPILKRAGLPRIRLHDLRHTFVTLLIAAGASAKEVQELARHAQISVTLGTYAHAFAEQKEQAVRRLGALLTAAGQKKAAR